MDKYGRTVSKTQESDNLRRFYRLEEDDPEEQDESQNRPDLARGEVLLESSDEDDWESEAEASDDEGIVRSKPIAVQHDQAEIDLDESDFADLDAQAVAFGDNVDDTPGEAATHTRRIAVVNLDWDHVKATHLYKIFSSIVSPIGPHAATDNADKQHGSVNNVARGKILSVRVFPSEFGKERMAKEEKEGPPAHVFKTSQINEEDVNEKTIYDVGDGNEYDQDAIRQYQLERLRYVF